MTVAQRLYLLIVSAIVGLVSLAGLGIVQMDKVYTAANFGNVSTVPSLLTLSDAFRKAAQLRTQVWQYMALSDPVKKSQMADKMRAGHAQVIDALNKYEKENLDDDKDKALLAAVRAALAEYDALRGKVLALADAGKSDEARDLLLLNQPVLIKLADAFDEHRQYNADLGYKNAEDAKTTLKNSNRLAVVIALLVVGGIAGMGLMLVRKIINSLNAAVKIAQTVAAGDLTSRIEVTSKDETGQLLQALKDMNDSLVNIVGQEGVNKFV
jgi:methyl-accepting chemotaxis protein